MIQHGGIAVCCRNVAQCDAETISLVRSMHKVFLTAVAAGVWFTKYRTCLQAAPLPDAIVASVSVTPGSRNAKSIAVGP